MQQEVRMEDYSNICYECTGYGDDFFTNDEGELEPYCPYCWVTAMEKDGDD